MESNPNRRGHLQVALQYSEQDMHAPLEREIKLRFTSLDDARAAVAGLGATLRNGRRLQSDLILDTADGTLRQARSALRVRLEPAQSFLTFKGPPQVATMKVREEIETAVADGPALLDLLHRLGYGVAFVYEKYREEWDLPDALVTIDETPIGVFVEIEGSEASITGTAARLGRGPGDYVVDSYRSLYVLACQARGDLPGDRMVFTR